MKARMAYAAAVAALLFVGAGCAARQNTGAEVQLPPRQEGRMEAKTEGSVDATVDDILKDSDDEQELLHGADSDAAELEADKAELNAFSDTEYEVK